MITSQLRSPSVRRLPRPLLAVPNVTAHPSTTSVATVFLVCSLKRYSRAVIGRAVSKRLVPTNVDMYRMYRNRDVLLQRHRPASYSSSEPHVGLVLDTHAGDDQIQRQYLRGSYSVPVHSLRSVPFRLLLRYINQK